MGEMIMDEPKSAIKHEGNYFIMDSEQLVCNPFQDLQTEAISEVQKRSFSEKRTEKVTTVKNNVCDNHFFIERAQLEREKSRSMKQLHDSSSKLRYEVKLLDLDRQRHRMEQKKRVLPDRDYTYDEQQISTNEKRLGANIACYYLERRMKFPMRLKSVSDISTSPLVQKARETLKLQEIPTSAGGGVASLLGGGGRDRAQTAKSFSSVASSAHAQAAAAASAHRRPTMKFNRRGSRSAPLVSGRGGFSAPIFGGGGGGGGLPGAREETRLPAIVDGSALAPHPVLGRSKSGQVKFMFEDPLKILTADDPLRMLLPAPKDKDTDEDSASLLSRPYTYHPGMMGPDRDGSPDLLLGDSDEDSDDPFLPDHIDLRALLFDRDGRREELVFTKSQGHGSRVPSSILRRFTGLAPKKTQDLIQHEKDQVQTKVSRFLQELEEVRPHSDDSDDDVDDPFQQRQPLQLQQRGLRGPVHVPVIRQTKPSTATYTTTSDDASENSAHNKKGKHDNAKKTSKIPKDAWKYIKGRSVDGSLKGTYSPEDIVLHTMTGVPLNRNITVGIPLHSAGRAMRHTPTFRMRKVVQRLINERTKYQQHEIEEIKRKMEQGMDLATAAASLTPASAMPGRGPSRNQAMPFMDPSTTRSLSSSGIHG